MPDVFARILEHPQDSLATRRDDLPPAIQLVVDRCLEKDRTKRYANVAELAAALAPFGDKAARASAERVGRIFGMRTGTVAPAPRGQSDPDKTSAATRLPPRPWWRSMEFAACGAAIALLVAVVWVAVARQRPEPGPTTSAAVDSPTAVAPVETAHRAGHASRQQTLPTHQRAHRALVHRDRPRGPQGSRDPLFTGGHGR